MLHPDDCMQEIESLTVIAGNAIMKVREKGVARTDKADGSPVTEADLGAIHHRAPLTLDETGMAQWLDHAAGEDALKSMITPTDGWNGIPYQQK